MFSIILTVLSITVHGGAASHLLDKLDQVLFFLPTWEKNEVYMYHTMLNF